MKRCQRIQDVSEAPAGEHVGIEEPGEPEELEKDYANMKSADLKALLISRSLPQTGKKPSLETQELQGLASIEPV
jgi:hypothetical protein